MLGFTTMHTENNKGTIYILETAHLNGHTNYCFLVLRDELIISEPLTRLLWLWIYFWDRYFKRLSSKLYSLKFVATVALDINKSTRVLWSTKIDLLCSSQLGVITKLWKLVGLISTVGNTKLVFCFVWVVNKWRQTCKVS